MEERVLKILVSYSNKKVNKSSPVKSIIEDSLDIILIGMSLEEEFDIEFEYDSIKKFTSVENIIDYIECKVGS